MSTSQSPSTGFEGSETSVKCNCPEKIIFCVDLSEELDKTNLYTKDNSHSVRTIWRNAIELFVYNKHLFSPKHEFGVIALRDAAIWSLDFTDDPEAVCKHVNDLTSCGEMYPSFDITSLYSTILENVKLPSADCTDPPYVVRVILMYGRSFSTPVYKDLDAYEKLMRCPFFFLDVFYTHAPPSQKNECEVSASLFEKGLRKKKITYSLFEVLADIYPKPQAMVIDVSKNATRIFDQMAKLLGHPLLRMTQAKQDFKLEVSND